MKKNGQIIRGYTCYQNFFLLWPKGHFVPEPYKEKRRNSVIYVFADDAVSPSMRKLLLMYFVDWYCWSAMNTKLCQCHSFQSQFYNAKLRLDEFHDCSSRTFVNLLCLIYAIEQHSLYIQSGRFSKFEKNC